MSRVSPMSEPLGEFMNRSLLCTRTSFKLGSSSTKRFKGPKWSKVSEQSDELREIPQNLFSNFIMFCKLKFKTVFKQIEVVFQLNYQEINRTCFITIVSLVK